MAELSFHVTLFCFVPRLLCPKKETKKRPKKKSFITTLSYFSPHHIMWYTMQLLAYRIKHFDQVISGVVFNFCSKTFITVWNECLSVFFLTWTPISENMVTNCDCKTIQIRLYKNFNSFTMLRKWGKMHFWIFSNVLCCMLFFYTFWVCHGQ